MSKFTRKFQTGTFAVHEFANGTSRWTLGFANGNVRHSFKLFDSKEAAWAGVEAYVPLCEAKIKAGQAKWVIYTAMSPVTGKTRNVFLSNDAAIL